MRVALALLLGLSSMGLTAQDFFASPQTDTPIVADDPVPAAFRERLHEPKVVLFSASWCDYCKLVQRQLDAANIAYLNLDIETDPLGKELRPLFPGGDFVPVTIIGAGVIYGADPNRIIALARQ